MNSKLVSSQKTANDLQDRLRQYRKENPKAYLRTIASELGSNEAQLLALEVGERITYLQCDLNDLLAQVVKSQCVTMITRNDGAVSEITGNIAFSQLEKFTRVEIKNSETLIDCEMVQHCFYVTANGRESLQFFDIYGDSAVKFFFKDEENKFSLELAKKLPAPELLKTAKKIPLNGLGRQGIENLVENNSTRQLIEAVARKQGLIEIEVANFSVCQRFKGNISKSVKARGWFNILDADFNLHVKEELIAKTYLQMNEGRLSLSAYAANSPLITISCSEKFEWRKPDEN